MKQVLKQIFRRSICIKYKKKRVKKISRGNKTYLENKELARSIIVPRVEYWAQKHGFVYNRIAIKNQKTRWGSCSSKKNLNFNYRLAFLPSEMMDYTIVHELCHLKEMSHSPRFWALVQSILPDYKTVHNAMKKISIQ